MLSATRNSLRTASAVSRRSGFPSMMPSASTTHLETPQTDARFLSSKRNTNKYSFRARRKASRGYRPTDPKATRQKGRKEPFDISKKANRIVSLDDIKITNMSEKDELEAFGPLAADVIRSARRHGEDLYNSPPGSKFDVETQLKMMDYFTSEPGSNEELVGERRALAFDLWDHEDRDQYMADVDKAIEEERVRSLHLPDPNPSDLGADDDDMSDTMIPSSQLAHGDWGEMLVRTDRVRKVWRGGRIESFRALVIGGNLNGCGGFGFGKAFEPEEAVEIACRMARHNIFFVDRYRGHNLTRDLVGRQNSCKLYLRTTDNGLRGNPLACEILKLMGITNVVAKAHGSRNHYNVVRATFKALMTHESLEEIALKRGTRLVNLEKAKRLQI